MIGSSPTRRNLRDAIGAMLAPQRITGTRATFSRKVDSATPAPEPFDGQFTIGEPAPYTVFTPAQHKRLFTWTHPTLVVDRGDGVDVVEAHGSEMMVHRFPAATMDRIVFGKVLLRAWLALDGLDPDGAPNSVRVEFNTVTAQLFDPLIERARGVGRSGRAAADLGRAAGPAGALGLKFVNYAERALRSGDEVLVAVAQPEILTEGEGPPWSRRRLVATEHLLMLTDRELISIGDDEEAARATRTRHGGTWEYVPRRSIRSAGLTERGAGLVDLVIGLGSGGEYRSTFESSRVAELHRIVDALSI